ncbi:MAG: HAD-IB family hydrolase [Acidimicrobiaceae bacterium]|mgnify:CR=1 FL=1|nr:HAD-IB family hydrolase [Acidimicrobiaceae bacterium]
MIKESLKGKKIAITGSTGFLGTALVELLLREIEDIDLRLLIRPSGKRSPSKRLERDILRNDAFDTLRKNLGPEGFEKLTKGNMKALSADISKDNLGLDDDGLRELSECDIVIHSAAAVSFDEPLDRAAEVNLMGPVRLVETLQGLNVEPHLVMVSTCYVAGNRKGTAPEKPLAQSPFYVPLNWKQETDAARRTRSYIEDDSRRSENLERFRTEAKTELGAPGISLIAAKTEQIRERWVKDKMVEAGRERATSLGFPDAYAFTKAMAEQAVQEIRGTIPLSIVRPSIIESSWDKPNSGWIRGFRMAEPIILNFGRGTLKEFPGIPEGVVDIIPVDLVASAIVAVAAQDKPDKPFVVQVASGACNPIKTGILADYVHEYFGNFPILDEKNQPITPSKWEFPGRGRVVTQLTRAKRLLQTAENTLHKLPIRGNQAMVVADLEEKRIELDKAMEYITLYGKYVECEAIYDVTSLLRLWENLDDEDRKAFPFDPRVIDWRKYVYDIHLPTVVIQGRVKTTPSAFPPKSRNSRLRKQILDPSRQLAVFDLENTLIASNVVSSWGYLATKRLPSQDRIKILTKTILEAPSMLAMDRRDRTDFLRNFYRKYEGAPVLQINEDSLEMFNEFILNKSFPAAIRRVREHRALGHRTLLITGALDFVVQPLKPLFDEILAPSLEVTGKKYSGRMTQVPPIGETRAAVLRDYAQKNNLDLKESIAYADSTSDLPMLEAVGFPVAVNPETKLATLARRRGWLVENFQPISGSPKKTLPLGKMKE